MTGIKSWLRRLLLPAESVAKSQSPVTLQKTGDSSTLGGNPAKPQMHVFSVNTVTVQSFGITNWWALTAVDLNRMAVALLGERAGGWVRERDSIVIAAVKRGALAAKVEAELAALATACQKILSEGGEDAPYRAAAFYHLRFENIHPLREGNGRVGRMILAAQLHQSLGVPVEETFSQLNAHANDYMMVFPSNNPTIQFELMLDVLARLTGHVVTEKSAKLPASILPLHPDRRPVKQKGGQQKRLPSQVRPPPRNNYYRKFG